MNSKTLLMVVLGVVILVVIAGGVFLVSNQKSNTAAPSSTPQSTQKLQATPTVQTVPTSPVADKTLSQTITYSDTGFSPKSITITAGTSVTFKNTSSKKMWVASAPHPSHTNYPEFDQDEAVGNGQSYTFTFEKVGSWNYHNHLSPSDFGTVVVQ